MPAFMKLGDIKGDVVDSSSGGPAVHDIAISKQTDNPDKIELTIKVLDGGGPLHGATTNVEYTLTVTDTETGHVVTERESGLIYSGESGGLNASGTGAGGHTTQMIWDDTNAAAADQLGKPKFEDIKLTGGMASHDGEPGELTTDAAGTGYELPPVYVSNWQHSASDAGSDPIGSFFAYDASFRGGVSVGAGDADHSAGAGYDYDAPGRLLVTTDSAGGSWTEHGTILTGIPPDADRPIGPFMGVFVGSGGGAAGGDLYLGTDDGVFEQGAGGTGSWGLDRIDQRELPGGHDSVFDTSYELFV